MAAKRPDFATLLRVDVAAQDHEGLDCFRHERRRLVRVGEGVGAGPRGLGATTAGRIDLGLDDAGVAVVDRPQNCDRASVPTCVTHEQLPWGCRSLAGCVAHGRAAATLWAACATVSLSVKPLSLAASVDGRT